MAEDQNREESQFSRYGRVLKKTLKVKEMDDIGINGSRRDEAHLITPSKHRKLEDKQYEVDEGRLSSSAGPLNLSTSSDTSSDDEFYLTSKKRCQVTSNPKTFARNRLNDTYSSNENGTESTFEDSTSDNESGAKSDTCLKVNSKQLKLKKNKKIKYKTIHKLPNIKYKGRRNTTAISSWNILANYLYWTRLQRFGNSGMEINHKRPKRGRVENQLDRQEYSLSPPVLGIALIDVAAHLTLLGNCFSNIGSAVEKLDEIRPGVYSFLLDMLLCSVGPLLCLTRNIAGLETLPEDVFFKILDHIAYIIPNV